MTESTQAKRKRRDRLDPRRVVIKGKALFQVDLGVVVKDGKPFRQRRTFADLKEAKTFAELKKIERANHGTQSISMPELLRTLAIEADRRITPYGVSILDAVDYYIKDHEMLARSETAGNAFKAFMASKTNDGLRARYLSDLKVRVGRFVEAFEERPLASIEPHEIDLYLRNRGVRPSTRNSISLRLGVFFAFAKGRGWVQSNPVHGMSRAKVSPRPPGILTVEETARLLEAASDVTLPFFALGAFAGIRTAELQRLEWKDIKWEERLIEVSALSSKTASRRFVTLQPNLLLWLASYRYRYRGKICPDDLRGRLERDRRAAGITKWPSNALRHSFGSYHLAHFRNANETALELGHHDTTLVFRHYRELVTPGEAERFWRIAPAVEPAQIVALA
jgi:integrase